MYKNNVAIYSLDDSNFRMPKFYHEIFAYSAAFVLQNWRITSIWQGHKDLRAQKFGASYMMLPVSFN